MRGESDVQQQLQMRVKCLRKGIRPKRRLWMMENKGIRKKNKQWGIIAYIENEKKDGDYRRGKEP